MTDAAPIASDNPRPKAKFGDLVENGWASEANPTRVGYFVREFRRPRGQMNPGLTWEITDGKGKFWELSPTGDHKITVSSPATTVSAAVAWRVKDFADGWILCHSEAEARREADGAGNLVQALGVIATPAIGAVEALERGIKKALRTLQNGDLHEVTRVVDAQDILSALQAGDQAP